MSMVQMLRRHDEDRVDVLVLEHLQVIVERVGSIAPKCLNFVFPLLESFRECIADGQNLDCPGVAFIHLPHHVSAARAEPDPADVDDIRSRSRFVNGGHCQRRRCRRCLQKIPAIEVFQHGSFYPETIL